MLKSLSRKRHYLWVVVLLVLKLSLRAQNPNLAQHYYRNGEYEKAAAIFKQLAEKTPPNDYYINKYIDCLMALEDFEQAERAVKKAIRRQKDKASSLYVTYGKILEREGKQDEAGKVYDKAIQMVPAARHEIHKLANAFLMLTKYDLAIRTFERGSKLLKDDKVFALNLADLYRRKSAYPEMIKYYLIALEENPTSLFTIKSNLTRFLPEAQYDELKEQLYDRLQSEDAPVSFQELLAWVFIQEKNFDNAFRQIKAIDARLHEDGRRVFELAKLAQGEQDFKAAIKAYDYIVRVKGDRSPYYFEAKQRALACMRSLVTDSYQYTDAQLDTLLSEYDSFLKEAGKNRYTARIMMDKAEIIGYYKKQPPKAIPILKEIIHMPGLDRRTVAQAKLMLGDLYLITGDIWESTLLYSQVDKEFKEDLLGQEARFRNARLSYFNGDFEWAQTQFSVLKNATSRPIANDAIDMSVFIMDNLGLDTTDVPLRLYAQAEFFVFQNRFEEAFAKMDSLQMLFPGHGLEDDVLYLKGNLEYRRQNFEAAKTYYEAVVNKYPEELRADNALYKLADMALNIFHDKDRARELYEKLFLDYPDSTFAIEARKKFRQLRGDDI